MKKLSQLKKKYHYVFYDKSFGKGGQEGRGFYHKNKKTISIYDSQFSGSEI